MSETSSLYDIISVTISALSLVLSGVYLRRVIYTYRTYHDERAAVSLSKAIGLMVIAVGLTISASGLIFHQALLGVTGLSIARGALVALMLTLLFSATRPSDD